MEFNKLQRKIQSYLNLFSSFVISPWGCYWCWSTFLSPEPVCFPSLLLCLDPRLPICPSPKEIMHNCIFSFSSHHNICLWKQNPVKRLCFILQKVDFFSPYYLTRSADGRVNSLWMLTFSLPVPYSQINISLRSQYKIHCKRWFYMIRHSSFMLEGKAGWWWKCASLLFWGNTILELMHTDCHLINRPSHPELLR